MPVYRPRPSQVEIGKTGSGSSVVEAGSRRHTHWWTVLPHGRRLRTESVRGLEDAESGDGRGGCGTA